MVFLDELAANATARNVSIIVYSGNGDLLVSHRGSEGASVSRIL
jgi:carboxypeptidase D